MGPRSGPALNTGDIDDGVVMGMKDHSPPSLYRAQAQSGQFPRSPGTSSSEMEMLGTSLYREGNRRRKVEQLAQGPAPGSAAQAPSPCPSCHPG